MTHGRDTDAAAETTGTTLAVQALLLIAVFAAVTTVAELAGAANLGTAMGIGQIAFVVVLVYLLLRR